MDPTWTSLAEARIAVVHEIREQPWGSAFLVADPDGHVLEFAESVHVVIARFATSGMNAEDVVKRTCTWL